MSGSRLHDLTRNLCRGQEGGAEKVVARCSGRPANGTRPQIQTALLRRWMLSIHHTVFFPSPSPKAGRRDGDGAAGAGPSQPLHEDHELQMHERPSEGPVMGEPIKY